MAFRWSPAPAALVADRFSEAGAWALAGAAWSDSATPVTVGLLKILRDAGVTVRPQRTISADSCRGIPRATRLGIYKAELIRPSQRPLPRRRAGRARHPLTWVNWFNADRTHESIDDLRPMAGPGGVL